MSDSGPFDFKNVEKADLLLVEGIDDARFFTALLRQLDRTEVQVARVRGKDRIRRFLIDTLVKDQGIRQLQRLGIVRDADTSALFTFQSLYGALRDAGLPAPKGPWEIVAKQGLRVSLAILPDENSTGNLESLCLRSVESEPELSCVDKYVNCLTNVGVPMEEHHKSKVKLFAYLSGRPRKLTSEESDELNKRRKSGLRLGEAADAGVWDWNSPAFAQLADFLLELFTPFPYNQPD